MSRLPRPAIAVAALALAGWTAACAPDHAPPPPDRRDLAERQARLDEAAAKIAEIAAAPVGTCLALADHDDPRVRRAVALRLPELGQPARGAIPALLALLGDDEPAVRTAAARALGSLADERAVDPLIAALVDQDAEVRLFSWKALRKHGPAALARLVSHLRSDSPLADFSYTDEHGRTIPLRVELRNQLPRLGKAVVPDLLAAMEGGEEELVVNALRVLWQIGPDAAEAVPALVALLETGDQELRFQSTRALGAIGDVDPAVLPALRRAAKDQTSQVRKAAERALKDIAEATRAGKGKHPRHGAARPGTTGDGPAEAPPGEPASEAEPAQGDLPG